MDISFLKKIGFTDKTAHLYMALLQLGPSSVRLLAEYCGLNRGTTYDTLKWLQEKGVVNFYHENTKQHFVAENPVVLLKLIKEEISNLSILDKELSKALPELQALHNRGGARPVARYFARKEIGNILTDVLLTCEQSDEKQYQIYSAEGLRKYLYEDFPTFSDVRVAKGIAVKVIAIGEGGELRGMDERKWLQTPIQGGVSTYILIYPGKTAYISLDARQEPMGVMIENMGIHETQKFIFDCLWNRL